MASVRYSFTLPTDRDIASEASPPRGGYRPPPVMYKPFSRENTSYTIQNSWMTKSQDANLMTSQHDNAENNSHHDNGRNSHFQYEAGSRRPKSGMGSEPSNEYFQQYMKLKNRMAYRYPNPGPPRLRNGSLGSNWRHVRQVLGYGGNNICFIDGVVKQYDSNNFNEELSNRRPFTTNQATPLYAVNQHDVTSYNQHVAMETEKQKYKPWQPSVLPPLKDTSPPNVDSPRAPPRPRQVTFNQYNTRY